MEVRVIPLVLLFSVLYGYAEGDITRIRPSAQKKQTFNVSSSVGRTKAAGIHEEIATSARTATMNLSSTTTAKTEEIKASSPIAYNSTAKSSLATTTTAKNTTTSPTTRKVTTPRVKNKTEQSTKKLEVPLVAEKNGEKDKKEKDVSSSQEIPEIALEKYPIEESHSLRYLIVLVVLVGICFVGIHFKKKIMGLIIEGPSTRGGSRRAGSVRYRRLSQNDDVDRSAID